MLILITLHWAVKNTFLPRKLRYFLKKELEIISKLINEIKNLNYLENNEKNQIINMKKILPSNKVTSNRISLFMINWSNNVVIIALLTISAIALSKQAWA